MRALGGVSLSFEAGEVHGVIGENGAGKSTLMKILAGVERGSSGDVLVGGVGVEFRGVQDAMRAGVAMIHQELNLVDDLSVAENLFLGREGVGFIDRRGQESEAERWLLEVGADFGPTKMLGSLSLAEKQLVEIAKVVSTGAEVLIMDEPTAVLSVREKTALFDLIRRLKSEGKTVILISHLLGELIGNCDRISVLRDGEYVGTVDAGEVDEAGLAAMMVGRELGEMYPNIPACSGEVVFEVEFFWGDDLVKSGNPSLTLPKLGEGTDDGNPSLTLPKLGEGTDDGNPSLTLPKLGERIDENNHALSLPRHGKETVESTATNAGCSLRIRSGEVVGFAGLIGSGRTELWEAVLGLRRGHPALGTFDREWVKHHAVYVSEDRKGAGLHLDFSVEDNIALPWLGRFGGMFTNRGEVRQSAEIWRENLAIKVPDVRDRVGSLSGGNQQKVSLAKWLFGDPELVILDEPTRGVDVGSKAQIYEIIAGLVNEGKAVVVISSEMQELVGLCHRVVVMRGGYPVGVLERNKLSEERIMELAAGVRS